MWSPATPKPLERSNSWMDARKASVDPPRAQSHRASMSRAKSYKAAYVVREDGGFKFEVRDTPMPDLAPHEILVKLAVTGVCGTDMGLASGHLGPCRDILGHEGVGYVVELGSGVLPSQVEVGQRVGIAWLRDICGKCAFCLADGGEVRCVEQMNSGRKLDGTFAEYALIPSRYIIRIPKEISLPDPVIAPILCGGVTAYKALKIAGISGGQWVAISGAGGDVGSLGIQYARAMGYRVLAIDVGDTKGKFCLSLGADKFIDAAQEKDLANAVCKATNGRMAHAVLVTAGSTKAYQDALRIVAPFGAFVCVGIPPPTQHITFHPLTFIDKGIRLLGSAVGTKGDILEALEFVQRGMVKPSIQMIDLENLTNVAKDVTNTEKTSKYVIKLDPDAGNIRLPA